MKIALWDEPCPFYLFLAVLNFSYFKLLQYHHLPHQVVTPYKPQDDSEHHPLGRSASDGSDRAPLLKGAEPVQLNLPSGELVYQFVIQLRFSFLMNLVLSVY